MSQSNKQDQTCAEFQERLPHLFESEADLSEDSHLNECENCSELVRDLQYIADAAKFLMPIHDPSSKVWEQIQSKMEVADKIEHAG